MSFLLDVNVLIALVDRYHEHHDAAHQWLKTNSSDNWATCAITENGVIRIIANPRYPNSTNSPAVVAEMLAELKYVAGHEFWSEAVSILDSRIFARHRLLSSKQITDTYCWAWRCGTAAISRHSIGTSIPMPSSVAQKL